MRDPVKLLVVVASFAVLSVLPVWAQEADPLEVLKSDASLEDKMEACRQLAIAGGPQAIPALEALLVDEKLSHMARYALEPMPYPEAGTALRRALAKTEGEPKAGIIDSLGMRQDAQAVAELAGLLSSGDMRIVQAAAKALGKIATPEAVDALMQTVARSGVAPEQLQAAFEGLLDCAETAALEGKKEVSVDIYEALLDTPHSTAQVRAAALRGAVLAHSGEQGLPLLVKALHSDDEALFAAAVRTVRELGGGPSVTGAIADVLADLPEGRQIVLIEALGDRGDDGAGPAVLALAEEGPAAVRAAAIKSVTRMGYEPALGLMVRLASTREGEIAEAARNAFIYFPGSAGDALLAGMLEEEDPEIRRTAVTFIGQGGLDKPAPLLMKAASSDPDEGVRIEALKVLQGYAGIEEMPALLDTLLDPESQAEMRAAETALGALCNRQREMIPGSAVVERAVYGDLPSGRVADVTEKVARMVKDGAVAISAANSNFGDPAPNVVKQLRVDYVENNVARSKTVREGETLTLTSGAAPTAIAEALCAELENAQGETKLALLRLLGSTGHPMALDVLRQAAAGEGASRDAAMRALCAWPTADALPAVMDVALNPPDQALKDLAMQNAVRILKQSSIEPEAALDHYTLLMEHAATADEKKLLLSGLGQIPDNRALEMALTQMRDEAVRAEAVHAAVEIGEKLGKHSREDSSLLNLGDLDGWQGTMAYWGVEDGAVVGHSDTDIQRNEFLWPGVEAGDFYLAVDVKLEPNTANAGIQFRSKRVNEEGQAQGYQGDMGQGVWGRLYHEQGRGMLDWNGRAEAAVVPGEWNRYEILALGPAIWTAINGKLGVAFLDPSEDYEGSGQIAFQLHAGPPPTVRYRVERLVHNPKIELADMDAQALIAALAVPAEK
jgi:HEAT repeat protein